MGERGQGTVEWVGLVAVVTLLLLGILAAGVRVPGGELARAVASRILCAAALADSCGDEPALIAAYGTEVGGLVADHMPSIAFERGSRALPVDFRRCRQPACGDGTARGLVDRTDNGLPVTAFVHVVDCRNGGEDGSGVETAWEDGSDETAWEDGSDEPIGEDGSDETAGEDGSGHLPAGPVAGSGDGRVGGASEVADCSGARAGNLYLQYWLYYADSATLRGVPVAGAAGYHRDDWESVQVRIGRDGSVHERASSHNGYNHAGGVASWGSDAGIGVLRDAAERVGARPRNGWGPSLGLLRVSGGSHAGNASGYLDFDRIVTGRRIHLVPLEPIAASAGDYRFAVSPPWRKRVWGDPEAEGTS